MVLKSCVTGHVGRLNEIVNLNFVRSKFSLTIIFKYLLSTFVFYFHFYCKPFYIVHSEFTLLRQQYSSKHSSNHLSSNYTIDSSKVDPSIWFKHRKSSAFLLEERKPTLTRTPSLPSSTLDWGATSSENTVVLRLGITTVAFGTPHRLLQAVGHWYKVPSFGPTPHLPFI